MRNVKFTLPEYEQIEIHMLSDWHRGDPLSDTKLIRDRVEYIENTPNAYAVCMGDLADCAISGSKGDTYGAARNPGEQIRELVSLLEPIKDKVLLFVEGNHERRIYNTAGIWINEQVAAQLGKLEVYDPEAVILDLRFGQLTRRQSEGRKASYTGYITHGSGGGGTIGAKLNRLQKLAEIIPCDFYMQGHTHQPAVFSQCYLSPSRKGMETQLFLNAGASLQYGGYGAAGGYKPASTMNPVLILNGQKQGMAVDFK